jgi:hypothetical protein
MTRSHRAVVLVLALLVGLLVVPRAADAAPKPPVVQLSSPTTLSPTIAATGGPLAVRFTVDRAIRWTIGYRRAGSGAPFADFPDATGQARRTTTAGVVAPADPGTYDIAVTVSAGGTQVTAVAQRALVVTGPGVTEDQRCDGLDPAACLLPFPNDTFTGADPTTDTGRRVNLNIASTPRNVAGVPVDPTEWNRNDGFSPGSMALTQVPGLDLHATWGSPLDHVQDLSWYQRPDAPIVLLDADTGQRHPFWSELDSHATDPRQQLLILRPAVNLTEGHRYIVALRGMRRADGSSIPAGAAFAAYRDGGTAPGVVDARRPHLERLFEELASAGVGRRDLFLAWDFTVASERNLAERALHIRDDAFSRLGDTDLADLEVDGRTPGYSITSVTNLADGDTMRRVEGTITVPSYLTPQAIVTVPDPVGEPLAVPQSRFNTLGSSDGLPVVDPVQPTVDVDFVCDIPRGADAVPAHATLYGHGLLGGRSEASGSSTAALRRVGFAPCAMDWWGMSFSDVPNVALILADISRFPSLADRSQQGFLNFLYLGRALLHPDGLGTDPAFEGPGGQPLLAPGELFYDGNSQGGIMGGALVALAPDLTRAKLGVPAMNYSTLLNRSADWEADGGSLVERLPGLDPTDPTGTVAYADAFYTAYPSVIDQQLGFSLLQMLWDRAEADGYAHHLTDDPLPGTPAHQVMLQAAFSDHQVANVAAEVEGRTIGARLHVPATPAGLHWSVDPTFGFDTWNPTVDGALPGESVLVYWYSTDRGLGTPPNGNQPPRVGGDPHGDPRKDRAAATQVAHFLLTGEVVDVCDGGPCLTDASRR